MRATIVTPPALEPVTIGEAKAHLRLDSAVGPEDDLVSRLISAAREHVEAVTRRALITQTWDVFSEDWPCGEVLEIPKAPLQSVTSVTYTDYLGAVATFAATEYGVDTAGAPGRVVLGYGKYWPTTVTLREYSPIAVRFVAGYGATTASVPQPIRHAVLLLVSHWFENREPNVIGASVAPLPLAVDALLAPYRVWTF